MSDYRLSPTAHFHTLVELAVFPLASEPSLRLAPIALDPNLRNMRHHTASLWRSAERAIVGASSGLSLDEVVAMRDLLWFDNDANRTEPIRMEHHLRTLADSFLRADGSVARPTLSDSLVADLPGPPQARARNAWRWLSLALPPDLLLAALAEPPQQGPYRVETLAPEVARMLSDAGFAETHLHLGAGMEFSMLWVAAMRGIAEPDVGASAFRAPGADLDEGEELGAWLLRAAIARYLLAGFLVRHQAGETLPTFLRGVAGPLTRALGGTGLSLLRIALAELKAGALAPERSPSHAALQAVYQAVSGVRKRNFPRRDCALQTGPLDGVFEVDPLAQFAGPVGLGATAEHWFVSRSLAYLDASHPTDPHFSRLFWQTVRVYCLFYRHVVQRPMTPGLQWFIRFYGRPGPVRRHVSERLRFEATAVRCGWGHGLFSLEVRTAPEETLHENLALVKDIEQATRNLGRAVPSRRQPLESGLVLHLVRDRGGGVIAEGRPNAFWMGTHGDPRRTGKEWSTHRYSTLYRRCRRSAFAAGRLLIHFPEALRWWRAIDLCTDEAGVPTWVMKPMLRYLHDAGSIAARVLGNGAEPLRRTVHAGEDFVHLLTGMRLLSDAVTYLDMKEGDRIGHGLSLGLLPDRWARRHGRVAMCREDRLLDLVWAWHLCATSGVDATDVSLSHVEHEIARHADDMGLADQARTPSPARLRRMVDKLHEEAVLRRLGFPDGPASRARSVQDLQLELAWLTDSRLFRRGREVVWVNTGRAEIGLLQAVQRRVRARILEAGLTIEVNPSSNLLVGQLSDMRDHPLWRLSHPDGLQGVPPLPLCIGSDDPLTFATDLRSEYQLLHDALTMAGTSSSVALQWLDQVRARGLATRVTQAVSPDVQVATRPAVEANPRVRPMP